MRYIKLTPLDTLFFRDGSPFNAGETGQMEVKSVFPPSANTVVGCLRAAFARELGWLGHGRWKKDITDQLGDGAALAPLSFEGPHLLCHDRLLFPVPNHLLYKGKASKVDCSKPVDSTEPQDEDGIDQLTFLRPSDEPLHTDIGLVRLPSTKPEEEGFKNLEQAYVTCEGMCKILQGQLPDTKAIIKSKNLWGSEPRIGIHRDDTSRTTKDDAMYQVVHTRLARGVSLAMGVAGYDGKTPKLATLGGESRMVWLEETSPWHIPAFQPESQNDILRYTVVFITPAQLPNDSWKKPEGTLPDLPGRIVSACVGKPVLMGGWDSNSNTPQALEPYLPAGSVFFMEAPASDVKNIESKHNTKIGNKTAWGYGHILIGAWA